MTKDKKISILIVEDDVFLADLYKTKFSLDCLKKNPIDIVLLDLVLPKMGGFEILKTMKADAKLRQIPVILLTNLSQKSDVDKGLEMGADDYLIKAHFMPSEVVEKIKKLVK